MKEKIGLLIDSSSTIKLDYAKKHGIRIIPVSITDSQSKVYRDNNKDIPYETLLKRLKNGENFKTSMTPIGQLMSVVEEMSNKYHEIIFLPVSKGLSGQWQSAHIVKKEFPNLHIVNSRSAAYVNEIIAKEIIKNIDEGKSVQEILHHVEKIYDKTFSIFSVEDPTGMKSGGRITKAIVRVIDILKLQPIIRFDIKNEYAGIAKNYINGMKKMIKATFDWCKDINEKIREVCIYSSNYAKDKLEYIKKVLMDSFDVDKEDIHIRHIPPGVLIHTKPGSYGYTVLID